VVDVIKTRQLTCDTLLCSLYSFTDNTLTYNVSVVIVQQLHKTFSSSLLQFWYKLHFNHRKKLILPCCPEDNTITVRYNRRV